MDYEAEFVQCPFKFKIKVKFILQDKGDFKQINLRAAIADRSVSLSHLWNSHSIFPQTLCIW